MNCLRDKVESIMVERDELAKVVSWLKESESLTEESKLQAARERETNKEHEEEFLVYKKEVVEQHGKGFNKAVN